MAQARVLLVTAVLCSVIVSCAEGFQGSTPHLKDIFVGRCWEFQQKKREVSGKNCTKIWEIFHTAFAYKNPCNTSFQDYKPYFDEVGMDIVKPNKSLFWSGTYKEAHLYSDFDTRYTTLEDTMAGWMATGLTWCGTKSNTSDGINYSSCPDYCDYSTPFWGLASSTFAAKASGDVRVIVNGTRYNVSGYPAPAYRRGSYFGKFELPTMRTEAVTEIIVLVIHSIGIPFLESCGNGSIKLLQDDAKHRGIKTKCFDDPDDVEHLLCADHPSSRECLFYKSKTMKPTQPQPDCKTWKILAIVMLTIVAVFLIGAVVGIIYMTRPCFSSVGYARHL